MPLSITYENCTADDLEHGDTDDRGFLYEHADVRTFFQVLGCVEVEHVERTYDGATLYCASFTPDYAADMQTSYVGHIRGTPSTVERVLRLLRAKRMIAE